MVGGCRPQEVGKGKLSGQEPMELTATIQTRLAGKYLALQHASLNSHCPPDRPEAEFGTRYVPSLCLGFLITEKELRIELGGEAVVRIW